MPPVNQGSRGALVAWTVATSVAFVTASILAIVFYVNYANARTEGERLREQYAEVADAATLTSPSTTSLRDSKQGNERLLDTAARQSRELATLVAGEGAPTQSAAIDQVSQAVTRATQTVTPPATGGQPAAAPAVPTAPLTATIDALAGVAQTRQQQADQLQAQLDSAQKAQDQLRQSTAQQLAAKDQAVAAAQKARDQAVTDLQAARTQADTRVTSSADDAQAQLESAIQAQRDAQNQIRDLQTQAGDKDQEIDALRTQLAAIRIPVDQILKAADGSIQQVAGETVYINVGQGAGIAPGITFEVFDRNGMLPDPTVDSADPNKPMPKGKASIEVTRVLPGSSEARVIRSTPGQSIAVGDPIVNLVYDRNTKLDFLVYGKFDLNRDGRADDADADVIRRLVTQWGGGVVDNVGVGTDFVVLGQEPTVPAYTEQELNDDPYKRFLLQQAEQEVDAYNATRDKAEALSIPILNQPRFLYFVGYYDLAGR